MDGINGMLQTNFMMRHKTRYRAQHGFSFAVVSESV